MFGIAARLRSWAVKSDDQTDIESGHGPSVQPDQPRPPVLTAAQRRSFEEEGFLVLPRFFPVAEIQTVKDHVDVLWNGRHDEDNPLVIDAPFKTAISTSVLRMPFREVDDETRKGFYKLNNLQLVDPTIQRFVADPRLLAVLEDLFGGHTPVVYNTLLFERGSEQSMHFDTFFMPSPTLNMMAASWIAIDPVTANNGPLVYYPGSHLIEPYRFSDGGIHAIGAEMEGAVAHIERIIEEHGLKKVVFMPQPGDVLIWHAQLLHGGGAIINRDETRTSLVTHYWTTLDYPDKEHWTDLGERRYIFKKQHQHAVEGALLKPVIDLLADLHVTPEMRRAVPSNFDPAGYLLYNIDLIEAGANPYEHYLASGRSEGRRW